VSSILEGLSPVQRQAATHKDGPLVVFAGAGSGKTRIITTRIAYLIEQGVRPWEILAVTFTNKAAAEMRQRIQRLTFDGQRCHIATFHSACARWLREFAEHLGFTSDFSIYDDSDSTSALKKVIKSLTVEAELGPLVVEMRAFIHSAKTNGLFPSDLAQLSPALRDQIPDGGEEIYRRYQETLAASNAMDFGDLIMNVLLLLRRNTQVRGVLQSRYAYLMVDEFQDTNKSQLELVRTLCERHRNLFVVGDDDQSIYSWRGATPENILGFEKMYADAQRVTMAQNYRSAANIVAAASGLIGHNTHRAAKQLFSEVPEGEPISYRLESDGEMEAWHVIETVKRELTRFHYSDFAIFYRTNSQSRLLEEALRRENIPYKVFGTVRFYDRLEVKDILAYFRLVVNPNDDVSLRRIINVPARAIGKKAMQDIEAHAERLGLSLMATIKELGSSDGGRLGTKLSVVVTTLETISQQLQKAPLAECVSLLLEMIDYKSYLQKKFPDQFLDKNENIHELSTAIANFSQRNPTSSLADWLQMVTLDREEEEEGTMGGVSLMTLHTSKGLEFKRVFIVGVEEGLIPHRNSTDDPALLEEERRLFYVGMTRAREKLSLISARERTTFNQRSVNEPSQFLREIPERYLQCDSIATQERFIGAAKSFDPGEISYEYAELDESMLTAGSKVRHPTYGMGIIEGLEKQFNNTKAVVRFNDFGLRKVSVSQLELPGSNLF